MRTQVLVALGGVVSIAVTTVFIPAASGNQEQPRASQSQEIATLTKPGVDLTALPLGDSRVSLTGPRAGGLWSCVKGNPNAPGALKEGPWLDGDTWSLPDKVAVRGQVKWPTASFEAAKSGTTRTITTMKVPTVGSTGEFPISAQDPAWEYDRNPGKVTPQKTTITLPRNPAQASKPSCLPMGAIGVAVNGVLLYNALDGRGQDARAHEIQDSCEGHPNQSDYHYHAGSACVLEGSAEGRSTLFGYAFDGFGIYVERDKNGDMLTNEDLDACHGRTSKVLWNGKKRSVYHYVVTQEFPYLLGCFTGTNKVPSDSPGTGPNEPGPPGPPGPPPGGPRP